MEFLHPYEVKKFTTQKQNVFCWAPYIMSKFLPKYLKIFCNSFTETQKWLCQPKCTLSLVDQLDQAVTGNLPIWCPYFESELKPVWQLLHPYYCMKSDKARAELAPNKSCDDRSDLSCDDRSDLSCDDRSDLANTCKQSPPGKITHNKKRVHTIKYCHELALLCICFY